MSYSQIILLLFLIVTNFILLMAPIYLVGLSKVYRMMFKMSSKIALGFGYLIGINGDIGAGKTSLSSGLSHVYQMDFSNRIDKLMYEYQRLFSDIDFEEFNSIVVYILRNSGIKEIDFIIQVLFEKYGLNDYPIYNFLNFTSVYELTKSYITAINAIERNNFVASKTRFYSRITGSVNLDYDISNQDLYKVFESGEYFIEDYLVELIDEAQDDNSAANWRQQEETGRKQYRNKFRHIHEQNNRMIGIKQDASDEVKKQRSLYQTNILITSDMENIFIYEKLYKMIKWFYSFEDSLYRIVSVQLPYAIYWLKNILSYEKISYDSYFRRKYRKPSVLRNVDNRLLYVKWFLASLNYNVFYVSIASNPDDLETETKARKARLVIPAIYCFTYPRFEFNDIQTALMSKSTKEQSIERNLFKNPNFFKIEENNKAVVIDDVTEF